MQAHNTPKPEHFLKQLTHMHIHNDFGEVLLSFERMPNWFVFTVLVYSYMADLLPNLPKWEKLWPGIAENDPILHKTK